MKKFLLLATFVLLAAVLFSCTLEKGDGKNDSAASGETTKSIGTDEITTVGVTTEAVTTEAIKPVLPDINVLKVGSMVVEGHTITVTDKTTLKDLCLSLKEAGADQLPIFGYRTSRGNLFFIKLNDGYTLEIECVHADLYPYLVKKTDNELEQFKSCTPDTIKEA